MDVLTPEQRHRAMQAIKSRDTKIEVLFRKSLWHRGVRYRKNMKLCGCHPDIAITKYRIAIFCDGDFWHGKTFKRDGIKTNTAYWNEKISRNIERDLENTIELRDNGWSVLRFWESEIKKNLEACIAAVLAEIAKRRLREGERKI